MISSRQLEYVQAVAHHLHFTRAAAHLRIAQPALSQQITKLERQLGVALFERDRHHVALTAAGAALADHAERVLADLAAVDEQMRSWSTGTRGLVRLGTARGLVGRLARVLAAFGDRYPGVHLELREMDTMAMVAELVEGHLDVATLAAPTADPRITARPLGSEPLVLIVAPDDPLTAHDPVPVRDLNGRPFVLFGPGSAIRDLILAAFAAADAAPQARYLTREYATARTLVSAGLAAAVVPRSVATEDGPPVAIRRLDPQPSWHPALAWSARRRPTPALAAFLDFAEAGLHHDQH
ncbi:MAG TPA: LysR family transcriptional regulator [Actinocatenispora sp.]